MKKHLTDYKRWLEKELYEELEKPKGYKNYCMVGGILEAITNIDKMMGQSDNETYEVKNEFTPEMAYNWAEKMQNEDGTMGNHWTKEQTTAVAERMGVTFDHITHYCWFITMNMYYSDAYKALKEYHKMQGFAEPTDDNYANFCALMSKSFLFDVDSVSPSEKLYYYYTYIVKK